MSVDNCDLGGFVVQNRTLADVSPEASVASLASYVVAMTWITANMGFFLYWKNWYARTQVRVAMFTLTYWFADMFFLSGWLLPVSAGMGTDFPCWLSYAMIAMSLGCFNATNFTRNSTFMLMTGLSYATQSNGRLPLEEIAKEEDKQVAMTGLQRVKEDVSLIWFGLKFVFTPNAVKKQKSQEEHVRTLVALRFITGHRGALLFTLAVLLPYMIVVIVVCTTIPAFRNGCTGCVPDNRVEAIMVAVLGGILLIFSGVFNVKCSQLPDVWGVFFEETLSAGWIGGGFLGFILISFTNAVQDRYFLNVLIAICLSVGFFFATGFQIIYARRNEKKVAPLGSHDKQKNRATVHTGANQKQRQAHASGSPKRSSVKALDADPKPTSSTGSSGPESPRGPVLASSTSLSTVTTVVSDFKQFTPRLHEILSTPHLVEPFEVHCLREFCDENLNFLQDAGEWKTKFSDVARTASTARAKKIINTFVRDGGLQQINLPYAIAHKLEQKVESGAQFEEKDFDEARLEVARLLEIGAAVRLFSSPAYRNILSGEMVVSAVAGEGVRFSMA